MAILPGLGLAIAAPEEPDLSGDELLRRADVAMYALETATHRGYKPSPQMGLAGMAGIDHDPLRRAPCARRPPAEPTNS